MSERVRSWCAAAVLVAVFVALGAAYVVVVPLWETPDEPSNVSTALLAATTRHVPTSRTQPLFPGIPPNAKLHPPLYFALMGLFCPVGVEMQPEVTGNPLAGTPAEIAKYRHDGGIPADHFPGASHLRRMRGISVLMGAMTVVVVWRIARLLAAGSLLAQLLSVGVFCLAPTFLFTHAAIDPLPMAVLSASVSIYQLLRLYLGRCEARSLRILGVLLAIGLGIRATLAFLYVPAAILVWRQKGRRTTFAGHILGPTLLVAVWMLVLWPRPALLAYRHLVAQLVKIDRTALTPVGLMTLAFQTRNSFWAQFGWANLSVPARLIDIFDLLTVVMLGAWGARVVRRRVPAGAGFAAAIAAVGLAGYAKANLAQFDPQGRYLGMLIGAYAPLGGIGCASAIGLWRKTWPKVVLAAAVVLAMIAANVYSLARVIAPAYAAREYEGLGVDAYQGQGMLVAGEASVGQTFLARRPGLTRIEFYFAPARHSAPDVLEFRLMESPLIPEPLVVARVRYPRSGQVPQKVGFTFLPLWDSRDRSYYVRVSTIPEKAPVPACFALEDLYLGGTRYVNDTPTPGDMRFTTYCVLPSTDEPPP